MNRGQLRIMVEDVEGYEIPHNGCGMIFVINACHDDHDSVSVDVMYVPLDSRMYWTPGHRYSWRLRSTEERSWPLT